MVIVFSIKEKDIKRAVGFLWERWLHGFLLTVFLFLVGIQSGNADEINHAKYHARLAARPSIGDGEFVLREEWWKGDLDPERAKLVQYQMFKGNTYRFWLALAQPGQKVLLNIYDRNGKLMEAEEIKVEDQKHIVCLQVKPPHTGLYYLRVALGEGAKGSAEWALIYAFKP